MQITRRIIISIESSNEQNASIIGTIFVKWTMVDINIAQMIDRTVTVR